MVEREPEFDANERDSWYALDEYRSELCPRCGNFRVICSTPDGVAGQGYHVRQDVCYVSASREVIQRRITRKFEKTQPDLQGSLPTDGVSIAITLTPDDSEDLLGLSRDDLFAQQTPGDQDQPRRAGD